MKHYVVYFQDHAVGDERTRAFDQRLRESFRDVITEIPNGRFHVISTPSSAKEVLSMLLPEDETQLSDTLLVLELGATGAIGCAGSDFIRELSGKIKLAG